MQITILGGGGFLGRKLATRLAADGTLGGHAITGLTLFDLAKPPKPPRPHSRSPRWPATSWTSRPKPSRPAPT